MARAAGRMWARSLVDEERVDESRPVRANQSHRRTERRPSWRSSAVLLKEKTESGYEVTVVGA
eukprot:7280565-Prymnesium_polylepis.1